MNEIFCNTPGKILYTDEWIARRVAKQTGYRAYKCLCGGWHVTSKTDQSHKSRYRFSKRDRRK